MSFEVSLTYFMWALRIYRWWNGFLQNSHSNRGFSVLCLTTICDLRCPMFLNFAPQFGSSQTNDRSSLGSLCRFWMCTLNASAVLHRIWQCSQTKLHVWIFMWIRWSPEVFETSWQMWQVKSKFAVSILWTFPKCFPSCSRTVNFRVQPSA